MPRRLAFTVVPYRVFLNLSACPESVVVSIAEQRQIFRGADHAFLWKPRLHVPDIYENPDNQRAFGRFLHACACFCCISCILR